MPSSVRKQIKECQIILSKTEAKLTFVNPACAHITLKFIGEVDPSLLEPIIVALCTIRFSSFPYQVTGVGANNLRSPRVIWATVQDGGACALLHRQLEDALATLGIARDGRAFTPHTTLARVKRPHLSLIPALKHLSQKHLGEGEAIGIRLKKSTLLPSGPLYEDLLEVRSI
ncbi:MAG: RNA 2',3'-cyclic phosphodiesterase [Methanomicrobiales archaeon]|nr:RNA 2',3'-cyclic phosphodiesterase [Methanomicrobiales archaeon]